MEVKNIRDAAELSMAAYADFALGEIAGNELLLQDIGMSKSQADRFKNNYKIALPTYNNPTNSFSATVFEAKDDGSLILAIRGSGVKDWITTNHHIYHDGAGYPQLVALFNWWSRITTPTNEYARQFTITDPVEGEAPQLFESFRLGTGELSGRSDSRLLVTGHSLGGHLAMAFGSLFPGDTEEVIAFNAPGFTDIDNRNGNFFRALGASGIPSDNWWTSNVIGRANSQTTEDWSIIAGLHSRPGSAVDIEIEKQWQSDEPNPDRFSYDHSIQMLADSANVFDLLTQLDPSLNENIYKIVFEASSNSEYKTLERIVDALSDLVGRDRPKLPTGNLEREALYKAIYEIQDNAIFKELCEANISIDMELGGWEARNDFGVLLSTVFLSPLVIHANDEVAESKLKELHSELAAHWTQDQDLEDEARFYTDQYLEDRGFMRSTLRVSALLDEPHGNLRQKIKFTNIDSNEPDSTVINGDATGYVSPAEDASSAYDHLRARYVFGSGKSDSLSEFNSSDNNDHLYGMAGNDSIEGGKGSDHIDGGLGDDILKGGEDGDVLRGNSGIDTLLGGDGIDSLNGGVGADKFKWYSGDGDDVIVDSDDSGDRIFVNDIDLSNLTFKRKSIDSPFYVAAGHPEITLHYDGILTVNIGSGADAGSISAMQYTPATGADYGIHLTDYTADWSHPTSVTVSQLNVTPSDWIAYYRQLFHREQLDWPSLSITFDGNAVPGYTGDTVYGALAGTFEGGPLNDVLLGNAYGNELHGLAGQDYVNGRSGDDFISGEAGSDDLHGDEGDDVIYGSSEMLVAKLYQGGAAFDQFYLSQGLDKPGDVNTIAGDQGMDFLTGGEYTDYIDGGEGQDWLFGGTGEDFLSGGVNGDFIYGDSTLHLLWEQSTGDQIRVARHIAYAAGADGVGQYDDVIHGGDGNDLAFGELGNDTLYGEAGNDRLTGDRDTDISYYTSPIAGCTDTPLDLNVALHGDDQLFGGAGVDVLRGLGGSDLLVGGTETDFLLGGAGNDVYLFHSGDGTDLIQDEQGVNTLVISGFSKQDLRIEIQESQVFVGRPAWAGEDTGEGFFLSRGQWDATSLALETADSTFERAALDTVYFDGEGYEMFTVKGSSVLTEAERNALFTVDSSNPHSPRIAVGAGVDQARLEGDIGGGGGQLRIIKGAAEYVIRISSIYMTDARSFIQTPANTSLVVAGAIYGSSANDTLVGSSGVDEMHGYDGADLLYGQGGNDTIRGGNGMDMLLGGDGDDTLDAASNSADVDYFMGGTGSDTLMGGYGSDRYAFAAGDGKDRLIDAHGPHNFEFAAGVDRSAVVLYYTDATEAKIRLQYGQGDLVTTDGDFSVSDIASVQVADTNIPLQQRSDLENGTFYDSWMNDVFETGSGNDVINLQGRGTDVYRFRKGDGQDVLAVGPDSGGQFLKGEIHFAADVDLNALTFTFGNADAMIGYGSLERIKLDTGTINSPQDNTLLRFKLASDANPDWIPVMRVREPGTSFYGSYGTDHILGSDINDTILPGYGDDIVESGNGDDAIVLNDLYQPNVYGSIGKKRITGQGGNDAIVAPLYQGIIYTYNKGDGHDTIRFDWSYGLVKPYNFTANQQASTAAFQPNGADTLVFGAGISRADLRFVRSGNNLTISLKDGSGSVTLQEFFHAWDAQRSAGTANALFALMDGPKHVNADTLLHPTVLAALPTTPISFLRFANDTVFDMASGLSAVIEVSNETVTGTEADDYLHGSTANDVIRGYGGNDIIEDLAGTNSIDAGTGNDTITVAGGNVITAGTGNDTIIANGNNIILAGEGVDHIFATGNNLILGGVGDDSVWLNGGNNVLAFAPGDGHDVISFTVGGTTILSMAADITPADLRVYRYQQDGSDSVQIYLPATGDSILPRAMVVGAGGSASTPHPHATLTEVRFANGTVITGDQLFAMALPPPTQIQGTDGADSLVGTSADEFFFGGRGDDIIDGAAGNDFFVVIGHDQGADRIVGGQGVDAIVGSTGDDTIALSAMPSTASVELIDGGGGANVIAGNAAANGLYFANTRLLNISQIEGRDGDDWIWGSQADDVIVGGRGNDVLVGEGGNDTFISAGTDQGTDQILGGGGNDVLRGGAGDDVFYLSTISPAAGLEVIDGGRGVNSIAGTADNNVLNFSATQLLNIGRIEAKAGNDTITGSQGSDWLLGDAGYDTLDGEAGNDVVFGGTGDDVLVGDGGDDIYMFALGDGRDQINNDDTLATSLDRLWLTNADYDHLWFSRVGDSLAIDVVGTTDQVRINHWYSGAEDQLDVIYARNRALMRNQVDQLVNAMAAFDAPSGVGAVIPQATRMELESTLAAVWKAA